MNIPKTTSLIMVYLCFVPLIARGQWIKQPFPSNENLYVVRFISPETGWILGAEHVFKTTDVGNTWLVKDSVLDVWRGLYVIDGSTVIYLDYERGIRRTSDGGDSWFTVDSTKKDIVSFNFVNSKLGFASGGSKDSSSVYKTTDGGKTWTKISRVYIGEKGWDFEKVSFINLLQGWATSYGGEIFYTSDGGYNWNFQDSTASNLLDPLRDIQFTTSDSGWAVGGIAGNSIILRTTDGGKTWNYSTSLSNITICSIREISMRDSKTGWFTGMNNGPAYIAKTTDGGNTWIDETPSDERLGFESVAMINDTVGYLVGDDGRFYTTKNGGITSVDKDYPNSVKQFSLSQNYPNPFNPTTVIRYELPKEAVVTIKLYDLLGCEVKILVNEEKPIGNYKVEFNGSNLASGIYFYTMQAGNFIETKKLILLK